MKRRVLISSEFRKAGFDLVENKKRRVLILWKIETAGGWIFLKVGIRRKAGFDLEENRRADMRGGRRGPAGEK